ncbi:ABC transporter substrate-binding protein [Paenibacillus xylaniclasticus]|uniref:ABC transporter substrate-binding protein n=1 Tax=Paenibacillus xylaniclasticus TaxID=588083 RepID=UPI0013E0E216|nr:extracellular solute-binding protein [Paenibacillus xylaniclasticus]
MVFNEQYGNVFLATHPNYDLRFISAADYILNGVEPIEAFNQLMDKEKPDIVLLSSNDYTYLTGKEKLAPLNSYINKNRHNISDITPGIMDFLKNDAGEIFGLAPTFTGTGLYYNKKLFEENGVPLPTNGITWDELFILAQRFAGSNNEGEVFGYYSNDVENPFMMALNIGQNKGLTLYNGKTFALGTEPWKHVFQQVADCFKERICWDPSQTDSMPTTDRGAIEKRSYPFLQGNVALALDSSYLYYLLKSNQERYKDLDWGLVTMPGSGEHPVTGTNIYLTDIFSIPSDSIQQDEAWEFIEYVTGDQYSRLLPRLNPDDLPVRLTEERKNDETSVFYAFDRISNHLYDSLRQLSSSAIQKLDETGRANMNNVIMGQMTLEEAIQNIEFEIEAKMSQAE